MRLTKKLKEAIIEHAQAEYPNECCGVVVNKEYIPCTNLSTIPTDQFIIDPRDLVKAESRGSIDAYVHSHPNGSSEPSEPDLVQMGKHNKPWIICGYSPSEPSEVAIHNPNNFVLPLLGRSYFHGLQDCYSIVKDYYQRELQITLNDYDRSELWWETEDTESLYLKNFKTEGFLEVKDDTINKHDVILFKIGRSFHVNHAGIFLGDGKLTSESAPDVLGDSLFIHHPYNKQSLREIYGESWRDRTVHIIRHKDLIQC